MNTKIKIFNILLIGLLALSLTLAVNPGMIHAQEEVELIPLDLDETEWEVEMVYISEKGKEESSADKLIFKDKQFISEQFEDENYKPTNYSLTAQTDGSTKFGTMQVKNDKETSFWKGIVKEDSTINGSVHTQFAAKGTNRTTYFTGKMISGVLVPMGQAKPAPTPPPAAVDPVIEDQGVTDEQVDEATDQVSIEKTEAITELVEKPSEPESENLGLEKE